MTDREKFNKSYSFVAKWEGGYVNHPSDPGGATNKGVTQRTYDSYRKSKGLKLNPVKNIAQSEVEDIYYTKYWLEAQCDELSLKLAAVHFDTAVNFGVFAAVKMLQTSLGELTVDGDYGPKTAARLGQVHQNVVASKYCELRKKKRWALVKANARLAVFLKGWLNRDNALVKFISTLA